jgi:hypothetical protein
LDRISLEEELDGDLVPVLDVSCRERITEHHERLGR